CLADIGTQLGRVVERERAHRALRQAEERTRTIIESGHDAFIAMNADGCITDWNHQAETMLGWTRPEVLGKALAETIIPPAQRDAHWIGLRRFLATGEGPVLNR